MASQVEPLDVWLYGIHVARLTQPNSARVHYRMDFTEEALDTYGEGRRILSLALPVARKPVADAPGGHLPVTSFLKGLLPEGNLLQQLATAQRVPTSDQMALLRAVGADCAGAIQFLRAGTSRPQPSVRRLSSIEVTRIVADLPTYNLPDGTLPQASLAGIQDKVLLVDLGGGQWGLPENGAASTHIVKPEPLHGTIPHLITAENWSLHVATEAGLTAVAAWNRPSKPLGPRSPPSRRRSALTRCSPIWMRCGRANPGARRLHRTLRFTPRLRPTMGTTGRYWSAGIAAGTGGSMITGATARTDEHVHIGQNGKKAPPIARKHPSTLVGLTGTAGAATSFLGGRFGSRHHVPRQQKNSLGFAGEFLSLSG